MTKVTSALKVKNRKNEVQCTKQKVYVARVTFSVLICKYINAENVFLDSYRKCHLCFQITGFSPLRRHTLEPLLYFRTLT